MFEPEYQETSQDRVIDHLLYENNRMAARITELENALSDIRDEAGRAMWDAEDNS